MSWKSVTARQVWHGCRFVRSVLLIAYVGATTMGHIQYPSAILADWMEQALSAAREGVRRGQAPFAAAIYRNGQCIAAAHNTVNTDCELTRHGEVNAIDAACQTMCTMNLKGCVLVSTGEPCALCASAAMLARVDAIIYGADHQCIADAGYATLDQRCEDFIQCCSQNVPVIGGIRRHECERLLRDNPAN